MTAEPATVADLVELLHAVTKKRGADAPGDAVATGEVAASLADRLEQAMRRRAGGR